MQKKTKNENFKEAVKIDFIRMDKELEGCVEWACIYVRSCVPEWGVHKTKRFVLSYVNR